MIIHSPLPKRMVYIDYLISLISCVRHVPPVQYALLPPSAASQNPVHEEGTTMLPHGYKWRSLFRHANVHLHGGYPTDNVPCVLVKAHLVLELDGVSCIHRDNTAIPGWNYSGVTTQQRSPSHSFSLPHPPLSICHCISLCPFLDTN